MKKSWIMIVSLALCMILLNAAPLRTALADTKIPVSEIYLSDTSLFLEPRSTWLLYASAEPENATNRKLEWESSNRDVAAVDLSGKVIAIKPGTTDITVTAADGSGKKAVCRVTVGVRTDTPMPVVTQKPANATATPTVTHSPSPTSTPSPTPRKGAVAYPATEKGGLNLRAEPDKNSRRVTVIPRNAPFTVLSVDEEWSYAEYKGKTGYVMTGLYSLASQTKAKATATPTATARPTATPKPPKGHMARVITQQGDLNMRTDPQRHAKRVYLIPRGAEIEILAYGTQWCYARYDAHTGYVQTKYLLLGSGVKKTSIAVPVIGDATAAPSRNTPTPSPRPKASATPVPQQKTFAKARKAQVVTSGGGLNMRESATSRAARILVIPNGATVQVHSIEGRWCKVSYNGTTGYVMTQYLKIN